MLESWWMRHFSDDQTETERWEMLIDTWNWNATIESNGIRQSIKRAMTMAINQERKGGEKLYKSCLVCYLLIYFEGTNQRGGGGEGRRRRRRGRYCHDSRDVITRTYPFEYCGTDECDLWLHTLIVLGELGGDTEAVAAAAARGHQFENWEKGIKISIIREWHCNASLRLRILRCWSLLNHRCSLLHARSQSQRSSSSTKERQYGCQVMNSGDGRCCTAQQ